MESFKDQLREGKTFIIKVDLMDGSSYFSSKVPMDLLEDVVGDIDMVQVEGIGLTIWDKDRGSSITFAKGTISSVEINYSRD